MDPSLLSEAIEQISALRAEIDCLKEQSDEAIRWSKELELWRETAGNDLRGMFYLLGRIIGHSPSVPADRLARLLSERAYAELNSGERFARTNARLQVTSWANRRTNAALCFFCRTFEVSHRPVRSSLAGMVEKARQMLTFELMELDDLGWETITGTACAEFRIEMNEMPDLEVDPDWMTQALFELTLYALARSRATPKVLRFGSVRLESRGVVCYLTDSASEPQISVPRSVSRWRHTYSAGFAAFCRVVQVHGGMVWKEAAEPGRGTICFLMPDLGSSGL